MMRKIKLVCLVIMFQFHQIISGCNNRLGLEEFRYAVHMLFMCESWKGIKQKYKEYNMDINTPIASGQAALMSALVHGRLGMAAEILEEDNVMVRCQDFYGDTALHTISGERPYIHDIPLYLSIVKTLISRGCPVNALNNVQKPCLAYLYDYSDSNFSAPLAFSIDNGEYSKLDENGDEWHIFNIALSSLLIKNGALLMVNQSGEGWNILSDLVRHIRDKFYSKSHRESSLRIDKNIIQDAFYKTFKRDYEQYKITYLTAVLILKRILHDKKIIMPKGPIKYIASLVCSNPTAHIEATLEDAWDRLELSKHLDKPPKEVHFVYSDIRALVTPGVWQKDWINYHNGDRSENNLVIKAMEYVKNEKHEWDK